MKVNPDKWNQILPIMLESARHSLFDLEVEAVGDLGIDDHHTVEDIGILLGEALNEALGNKKGVRRMAHALIPMDEALAMVALDLSGRSYTILDLPFKNVKVGELSTENVGHFLESLAQNGKLTMLDARVKRPPSNSPIKRCTGITSNQGYPESYPAPRGNLIKLSNKNKKEAVQRLLIIQLLWF